MLDLNMNGKDKIGNTYIISIFLFREISIFTPMLEDPEQPSLQTYKRYGRTQSKVLA